jgi:hypothetical protein
VPGACTRKKTHKTHTATRAWGSIGSAEIFEEGTAYTTTKWDAHRAGLARYRQAGRGGRLMGLGVHAHERSAAPPVERDYRPAKGGTSHALIAHTRRLPEVLEALLRGKLRHA